MSVTGFDATVAFDDSLTSFDGTEGQEGHGGGRARFPVHLPPRAVPIRKRKEEEEVLITMVVIAAEVF